MEIKGLKQIGATQLPADPGKLRLVALIGLTGYRIGEEDFDDLNAARAAWNACKAEVLAAVGQDPCAFIVYDDAKKAVAVLTD